MVDGVAGVEVVTERVWGYAEEINLPRVIVVSRMDRDRADAERVLESLNKAFGRAVVPLQFPIGKEKNLTGVVDLVRMKAYTYELGGNGKGKEGEIPAESGRRCAGSAREAGRTGCRRRRQADGGILRQGHDSRRASDSGAA